MAVSGQTHLEPRDLAEFVGSMVDMMGATRSFPDPIGKPGILALPLFQPLACASCRRHFLCVRRFVSWQARPAKVTLRVVQIIVAVAMLLIGVGLVPGLI
ncbi:hypothetical protein RGR602_PC00367 (plasmid) [Rhizobium gallicum bv. gallicum R602sp]|uniref:Uncharacterized protein n=1 Tax=Rhizobium gallicum bv. gallicum R602sp TaxID=1041138 RepID=A0A0B4XD02_9HYPH|nr:hypothetical protein RGR602_PC00367 [Rhizobium gallicum bv. gallicum R602sp]